MCTLPYCSSTVFTQWQIRTAFLSSFVALFLRIVNVAVLLIGVFRACRKRLCEEVGR